MTNVVTRPPGFLRTVWLLLAAARRRAVGRQKRQQQLLSGRGSRSGHAVVVGLMVLVHGAAAFAVITTIRSADLLEAERSEPIAVSHEFVVWLRYQEWRHAHVSDAFQSLDFSLGLTCRAEAVRIARQHGGDATTIAKRICAAVSSRGSKGVVDETSVTRGLTSLPGAGGLARMLGSILLLWWGLMLVCQGEGIELDVQRRRHPMWEWLLSHPVRPAAMFAAEMLSPIAANPLYLSAPLFPAILYGAAYNNPAIGLLAALLVGVPITVAAACLGKGLEIGVVLRFPLRTRGAILGLLAWLGFASMVLLIVGAFTAAQVVDAVGDRLEPLAGMPWPWLGWFLGARSNGTLSLPLGLTSCWIGAGLISVAAVCFSVWGARKGLISQSLQVQPALAGAAHGGSRFGREPLYRKELLWFRRDPGAIIQTILIPLTLASFELFNARGLLSEAPFAWNVLCGGAIVFGAYFLWVLGPRSLASEGAALWIALGWPRGLESLLKAKARLWSLIASVIVGLVLCYAAVRFPQSVWQIALVGVGWFLFARSMADKAVTLVTITSPSGDAEKIPWARRWATQLGMLTFAVGILSRQWTIAFSGVVFSSMTAAAMWQNFRARLPYLYDPWSERLPPPPTVMHAMIAVSLLVEGGAMLTGVAVGLGAGSTIAVLRPVFYAISSIIVCVGVWIFLDGRGVPLRDILNWPAKTGLVSGLTPSLAAGAGGGLLLGLFGRGYLALLQLFPSAAEMIQRSQQQMTQVHGLYLSYALVAVLVAPIAEEFLFRGLLFRALDRDWGCWRGALGSATFFAIYHPPLAWLPVALVGVANALLFKRSGRLAPAVVLHMVYNAVVLT